MNPQIEQHVQEDLHRYLSGLGEIDEHMPQAPDIEMLWPKIAQSYIPDGIREYSNYPTVSLGWMMYIGMAIAVMWDNDWQTFSQREDLYADLRSVRGYDELDEYVREDVLRLKGEEYTAMERLVGECASRTDALLRRMGPEPGTPAAFHAYVACLHQLYLMGMAVALRRLGYHMTQIN